MPIYVCEYVCGCVCVCVCVCERLCVCAHVKLFSLYICLLYKDAVDPSPSNTYSTNGDSELELDLRSTMSAEMLPTGDTQSLFAFASMVLISIKENEHFSIVMPLLFLIQNVLYIRVKPGIST